MLMNVLGLQSFRQVHCLCRLKFSSKDLCSKGIFQKTFLKIPSTNIRSCDVSTDNFSKNDVEADKDSSLEVYRGSISKYIYKVKMFSLMTSVLGVATQPFLIYRAIEAEKNLAAVIGTCTFIGFFTFVTPVLLHLVTKKYVLTLHYSPDSDTYTAETYSFFLAPKTHKFKAEDVVIPEMPAILTTFQVKGQSYFVDKEGFQNIYHYKKIMGYDKPLNISFDKNEFNKK